MEFEWDPSKNQANFAKHGIRFELIAECFDDAPIKEIFSGFDAEPRWLRCIKIRDKFCLVVYTIRNVKVRIISARRLNDDERKRLGLL